MRRTLTVLTCALLLAALVPSAAVASTVPGAPTSPYVGQTWDAKSLTVSWYAPDDDGGAPVTGYNVYMATSSGGEAGTSPVNDTLVSGTSYEVTQVTIGQTYYFTVRAVNEAGESLDSGEVSGTAYWSPSAPTNVTATPQGYDTIVLSWGAPESDGGLPVSGYDAFWGTSEADLLQQYAAWNGFYSDTTSYKFFPFTSGQTYWFAVLALNNSGPGELSGIVSATVATKPSPTVTLAGPTSAKAGDHVTFTATVSPNPGGGYITFSDQHGDLDNVSLDASGQASTTTTFWYPGTYDVTATFSGSGDWGRATSNQIVLTVTQTTTMYVYSDPAQPGPGDPVTLIAGVSPNPGGGSVAFTDADGNALTGCGAVPVDPETGQATCPVSYAAKGTYTVNVAFSGFEGYPASTGSGEISVVVTTTTVVTQSAPSTSVGAAVTYTATVNAADNGTVSGAVMFYDMDAVAVISACSDVPLESGSATCTMTYDAAGTYHVTAMYTGSSEYTSSYMLPALAHTVVETPATTTPGAPTIESVTNVWPGNTLLVTFNAPASDGGSPITDYHLYMTTTAGSEDYNSPVDLAETIGPFNITYDVPVTAGQTYYFTVKAENAVGEGPASNELGTLATGSPSAPGNVWTEATYDSVVLHWSPPENDGGLPLTQYLPFWGTSEDEVLQKFASLNHALPAGPAATSYTFSGPWLTPGTYYFAVVADNGLSRSPLSAIVPAVVPPKIATVMLTGPASSNVPDDVTFTATVTPAPGGGTIEFSDGRSSYPFCTRPLDAAGQASCSTAYLSGGTYNVVARFTGFGNWQPAESAPLVHTVIQPTHMFTNYEPYSPLAGEPVTLIGAVSPNPGGGTVAFTDASDTVLDGCAAIPVDPGTGDARCQITYASAGTYVFNATFSGFGDLPGSTGSGTVPVIVGTMIVLTQPSASTAAGETVTYTASVTSSNGSAVPDTVAFLDWGTWEAIGDCGNVALDNGIATCDVMYDTPGTYKVTAEYWHQDSQYAYSYVDPPLEHQVLPAGPTTEPSTTSLWDYPEGTSETGVTVYYGVDITPLPSATDSGTVTFKDADVPIPGCSDVAVQLATDAMTHVTTAYANCLVSTYAEAGSHSIQAFFSGTATLDASQSEIVTHTVTAPAKTASTTSLWDYPEGTSETGVTVHYGVGITPLPSAMDSGSVTFKDADVPIPGCSDVAVELATNAWTGVTTAYANCTVTTYAAAGSHSIQAFFSGTATLDASQSEIVMHTVTAPELGAMGLTVLTNDKYLDAGYIPAGADVTWTYILSNMGNVELHDVVITDDQQGVIPCPSTTVPLNGSLTCTKIGTADLGAYTSHTTATAKTPSGASTGGMVPVPASYFGELGAMGLTVLTNDKYLDAGYIPAGADVTWTYILSNMGNVELHDVVITDDQQGVISCPSTTVPLNGTLTCTKIGTADLGAYTSHTTATAKTPSGASTGGMVPVPASYFGELGAMGLTKLTNDIYGDAGSIPAGSPVTWTYILNNLGNVDLHDVLITDDQLGPITCPETTLPVKGSITCTASGTAIVGPYTNHASATAVTPSGAQIDTGIPVTGSYFGTQPDLAITKTADQPTVAAGSPIGFTLVVTNTGNTAAANVVLKDQLPAGIDFSWSISPAVEGCTIADNLLVCTWSSIAADDSLSVHVTSPTTAADAMAPATGFDSSGTAADGIVSLGMANQYGVLGLQNTAINNSNVVITGDAGVSQGGKLTNMAPSTITGNCYVYAAKTCSGPGKLGGDVIVDPARLTQADTDALAAAAAAKALVATQTFGAISKDTTITGNGGLNVIQINGDIKASLTLSGGPDDVFIVNVTGTLTLGGSAQLGITGGVTGNHVLYNFTGKAGQTITTHVDNVVVGTLLAPTYSFSLDGAFVGEIIGGGKTISLKSGSDVYGSALVANTATVSFDGIDQTPADNTSSARVLFQ